MNLQYGLLENSGKIILMLCIYNINVIMLYMYGLKVKEKVFGQLVCTIKTS